MKYSSKHNAKITTRRSARMLSSKRAISAWISWVLIIAFIISLSSFMYRFMINYTEDSTKEAKQVVSNSDECRLVSISIDSACEDTAAGTINLTLTNRNSRNIDKIYYKVFEGRTPALSGSFDFVMAPDRQKRYSLDITGVSAGYLEILPATVKEDREIICAENKATIDDVPDCD